MKAAHVAHADEVTIVCGDRKWNTNSHVLATKSTYFANVLSGFDIRPVEIHLSNEDPELVTSMAEWLFESAYSDPACSTNHSHPIFHVKIYELAGKLGMLDLQTYAKGKFVQAVNACWGEQCDCFAEILVLFFVDEVVDEPGLAGEVFEVAKAHYHELVENVNFRRQVMTKNKKAAEFCMELGQAATASSSAHEDDSPPTPEETPSLAVTACYYQYGYLTPPQTPGKQEITSEIG